MKNGRQSQEGRKKVEPSARFYRSSAEAMPRLEPRSLLSPSLVDYAEKSRYLHTKKQTTGKTTSQLLYSIVRLKYRAIHFDRCS